MNHEQQQPLVQVRQQRNGPRNLNNSLFDPLPIVIENDEEDEMSIELEHALNEDRDDNSQDEIIEQQERLVVVEDI